MNDRTTSISAIEYLARQGFEDHPDVRKFRDEKVLHVRFGSSLDQIAERIQSGEQQSMTAVIGPTASGKTALVEEFGYQFGQAMLSRPENERTTLLCMELAAPENGAFKWKDDFYIPALEVLKEPCTAKKINVEDLRRRLANGDTSAPFSKRPPTATEYRNIFYAGLIRAKVIGALFDEGNHLRRPSSKKGVFSQYDSLKSRSNACRTHFVLLGTVELTDIFKQSGPISKRVYPIWLAPYGPDSDDKKAFGGAVLSIVEKLPVNISFPIERKLDELHNGSLGVFGLVHDWFDRALVRAIRLERRIIDWKDMQEAALHPIQLSGIAADLIQFRDEMLGVNTFLKERMATLFLPTGVNGPGDKRADFDQGRQKPFQRTPERDEVGQ